MSKGTVKVTPTVTKQGVLSITKAEINPYKVGVDAMLNFDSPGFSVNVGDVVDCKITSASTCNVVKVVQAAT